MLVKGQNSLDVSRASKLMDKKYGDLPIYRKHNTVISYWNLTLEVTNDNFHGVHCLELNLTLSDFRT